MRKIKFDSIKDTINGILNDEKTQVDAGYEVLNEDLYDEDDDRYDDDYTELEFYFGDGYAISTDKKYYLEYPKLENLTEDDIKDIRRECLVDDDEEFTITPRDSAVIGDLYEIEY